MVWLLVLLSVLSVRSIQLQSVRTNLQLAKFEADDFARFSHPLGYTVLLTIRYGNKVIEFEQGKNAIELPSKVDLEPTLQSIKKAADNGEFDTLLKEKLAYGSRLNKK